jgi:hypothetical protein
MCKAKKSITSISTAFIVKFCNTPRHAVQTITWLAMSPDMNPIEHVWDFIGRKINQRNPKCQNIDELRIAILHFLKDYTKGSTITNLRSIYHPERGDYDVTKMGFKTGATI